VRTETIEWVGAAQGYEGTWKKPSGTSDLQGNGILEALKMTEGKVFSVCTPWRLLVRMSVQLRIFVTSALDEVSGHILS
jgi:hypothetical protein